MRHIIFVTLIITVSGWNTAQAASFRTATVTEVVNDVKIVKASQKPTPAKVKETITSQDVIRTGRDSRTELRFQDNTLARVGSNSIFSFTADKREIDLKQGSVLFNSDKGKGGGQIKTAAATAAVTGTTIIVVATANGGFKLLILEGKSRIVLPGGVFVDLQAGQMTFINPGQQTRPEILSFDLEALIKGSRLVEGFTDPLDSMEKVQSAIDKQNKLIADGKLDETGQLIAFVNKEGEVQIIDMNSLTQILDIDIIAKLAQDTLDQFTDEQTALATAFSQDLIVDTDTVDPARVLNTVAALQSSPFNADGFYNSLPQSSQFTAANNTYINSEYVYMAQYNGTPHFAFLSEGNMYFNGVEVDNEGIYYVADFLGPLAGLYFYARGDFIFSEDLNLYFGDSYNMDEVSFVKFKALGSVNASYLYIEASDTVLSFTLGGDFNLSDSSIYAKSFDATVNGSIHLQDYSSISTTTGDLHLGALGTLTLSGSSSLYSDGGGNIILDSATGIYINEAALDGNGGSIQINNTNPSGSVEINNGSATIGSYYSPLNLQIQSAGNITLLEGYLSALGTATISLNANMVSGLININALDMSGLPNSPEMTQITMQAYTINLSNIDFPGGSLITLTSGMDNPGGYPTFGVGNQQNGRVNFINNVSKGGAGNIMNDQSSFDMYQGVGGGSITINDNIIVN